jgi:4'-phosphopantetheinyl transferase
MPPEKFMRSMIGYSLAHDSSLVGMSMVQGAQREVVNIGLGMKKLAVDPPEATVAAYVESLAHKVGSVSLASMHDPRANVFYPR